MPNKLKAIILLGTPGAGKGTQANLLAERFDFYHLDTGKMLRKRYSSFKEDEFIEEDGQKYYFKNEKKIYDRGELNSPLFILALTKETIKRTLATDQEIVLSGSPRTLIETEKLMPFLSKLCSKQNIKTFFLDLDAKDSIWRNSHRRICKLMNHSILYNKETEGLEHCPLDGSVLTKRELDKPEIIKERCRVFEKRTLPILKWLEEHNYKVVRINGAQPVADVFEEILSHL